MLIRDTKMPITPSMVHKAYSMSQKTVVFETDTKAIVEYDHSSFTEFLEVISRTAEELFRDTEMQDHDLNWKLEHVFDGLFRSVNEKVTVNEIVVEEFSDSDDDY